MKEFRKHLLIFIPLGLGIGLFTTNTFVRGFSAGYVVAALIIISITYYPRYNK